ncbi:MAG: ABC transporter ATP-binding protein [Rhodospirillaceae bacterium]|nr:ABC transporter ATP-binding protein [Rhodospirillaceae bacterium]
MLKVSGIHSYYGRAHILSEISLEVGRGEILALLGRNGAGKSTTMKSIIGLVPPAKGTIEFLGENIQGMPPFMIARKGLGYVPEDRRIFAALSILENLEVGRQPERQGAPYWTLERLFDLFPNLAELRDRPGGHISGGEQQMLTIARTLMGNPSAILLDEPSEGLAPVIVEKMIATIMTLKSEGLSVILSEQNLSFASYVADRATIIEKGQIRYEGTIDELQKNPDVRNAYLSV